MPRPSRPFLPLQLAIAMPYHGLLVFLGQILLLVLAAVFDHGDRPVPLPLALIARITAMPESGESEKCCW